MVLAPPPTSPAPLPDYHHHFLRHISDWWYRNIVNSSAILLQFYKSVVSVTLEKSLRLRTMDMITNIKVQKVPGFYLGTTCSFLSGITLQW